MILRFGTLIHIRSIERNFNMWSEKYMIMIETGELIKIYNDGILILEGKSFQEIKEVIKALLKGNQDRWEVELLKNILYTIYNNLSTMEVA